MTDSTNVFAVRTALLDAEKSLQNLLNNETMLERIGEAGQLLADCIRKGGCVYSCGNGGSLCDAMHFAEEMTGRYRKNRPPYAAVALSDAAHMSCVSNDFSYDDVFARFLSAVGRPGDVLLAISTSGNSRNIVAAIDTAKKKELKVVSLTGNAASLVAECSDIAIVTPAGAYADRVQELHIKCIHILIELIERELNPENYSA